MIFLGAHPDDETFGIGTTLAQYAISGVKVYYVCATGGELGTVSPEYMEGYTSIADLRSAEMECAAKALGLAGVIYLGYHDSGMPGSSQNRRIDALATAHTEEVAGKIAKIIRDLKPDVVITHDAGGGYGHPDHIAIHNATVKAFYAANNPKQYPEAGMPYQPHKLYFAIRPHKYMKFIMRLMQFFGQDPHHFGRNKDIDLTKMTGAEYPVNAVIRPTNKAVKIRNKAMACHASQGGGWSRPIPVRIFWIIEKLRGQWDYFMRDYPPPTHHLEEDLFDGVS